MFLCLDLYIFYVCSVIRVHVIRIINELGSKAHVFWNHRATVKSYVHVRCTLCVQSVTCTCVDTPVTCTCK